ncbi:MAG: hypothetical protein JO316_01395 [Abitibacteriaceae bacterium]|nr:hypothetical protein [Abditibacteriaceae bacterium]
MTLPDSIPYPTTPAARDRWILDHRPARHEVNPLRPYAYLVEPERAANSEVVPVATVFLTNRECPWRCLMCDLWRNTLTTTVPPGAITAQIDYALQRLPAARQIKLYNSGSFFDPRAIPREDYAAIASRLQGFERVIVECHPSLVGEACWRFQGMLQGQLEVAMGLETVHPEIGPLLNKRMTLERFAATAHLLQQHAVALRVFVLVKPPFMDEAEGVYWAERSVDFALDCGAEVVALIPTRPGNGALDVLMAQGHFSPPKLSSLEAAFAYALTRVQKHPKARVFADVWDLAQFSSCDDCLPVREERLKQMNFKQQIAPGFTCPGCGESV